MTVAWIYPGQGSQTHGMGHDLVELPGVRERLDNAHEILGWSLLDLTAEQICRTLYTQPALFLASALFTDQLWRMGFHPDCVAGHSLGEYSALYAAGVFDFATGLKLVKQRAALMDKVGQGTMAAVMGFDRERLEQLCASTPGVTIANDNSPDQVVISGTVEAVKLVTEQLKARRAVPLQVSGAFHSPLMAEAANTFRAILEDVEFQAPRIPIYSNVTAAPVRDPQEMKALLADQITSPVRWRHIVMNMADHGVTSVWEIGPGAVLTGLVKRTVSAVQRLNIGSADALLQVQYA